MAILIGRFVPCAFVASS